MIRCGSDQTYVTKVGRNVTNDRCGSDQTYVKKGGRNLTND